MTRPTGPVSRLTFGDTANLRPTWSADGRSLVYLGNTSANGGTYLSIGDVDRVGAAIRAGKPVPVTREYRDLWNTGWSLLLVIGLLVAEWLLRRRMGLR